MKNTRSEGFGGVNPIKCEKCGLEIKTYVTDFNGYSIVYRCDCEYKEKKKGILDAINEEKKQRIALMFTKSNLGTRFSGCTIDNFLLRPGTENSLVVSREYINSFEGKKESGMGLVLYGIPGNGKTHLMAAIVNGVIRNGYSAVFQPIGELMDRLNRTYKSEDENEYDIKEGLADPDLLALDDIGDNKKTEAIETRLKAIIDKRYRFQLPTIITTNLDPLRFEKYVGEKTYSRLCEISIFVHNSGTDYRKEKMKKNDREN